MSVAGAYLAAAGATFRRDLSLFLSYRTRLVTQLLTVAFTLTLFYYLSRLVGLRSFRSPDEYFAFVVIGLAILRVVASTLTTTTTQLQQELATGTFERMVVSPFGPVAGVVSLTLFPTLLAVALSASMLVLAGLIFGLDLEWDTLPLAVPIGVLSLLAFAPFGIGAAAAALLYKQAASGAVFAVAGISLISGLYFPVDLLPDGLRWASEVQPFTPAVDLLRHVIVGTELRHPAAAELLKLAAFALVLLPVSVLALRASVRAAQRRATITEY